MIIHIFTERKPVASLSATSTFGEGYLIAGLRSDGKMEAYWKTIDTFVPKKLNTQP